MITSISAPTFPAFKPLPKVHDYSLLFTRNGRAPYILGCVAEIVTANGWKTFIPVRSVTLYEAARTLGVPQPLSLTRSEPLDAILIERGAAAGLVELRIPRQVHEQAEIFLECERQYFIAVVWRDCPQAIKTAIEP